MTNVEKLREAWLKRGRFQPSIPYPRITEDGLVLGASTMLARKTAGCEMTLAGQERPLLALLSAAYGAPVSADAIAVLRRAARAWAKDDRSLAAILIAQMGLPKLTDGDDGTYRLFMASGLLDDGLDPTTLLKAWNIGTEALEKFNDNHDELGRFASGTGSTTAVEHARDVQSKKKPWLNHPNPEMREKLAEMESSADKPHGGYEEHRKEPDGALGRYQIKLDALHDAGWKNADGSWTAKAQTAGVTSDDDFLKNPEAQEQALTDVLQRDTEQLKAKENGSYGRIGSTVIDSEGNKITITEAGLLAAAHKQGAGAVQKYFEWVDRLNGNTQGTRPSEKQRNIQGRLRNAANTPYDPAATAAHATLRGHKVAN